MLIQIGGLGIMDLLPFFFALLFTWRSFYEKESSYVFASFDEEHQLSIRELLKRIMALTFTTEAIGATILFIHWLPDMGAKKAAYYAIFSRYLRFFANAGICLFFRQPKVIYRRCGW